MEEALLHLEGVSVEDAAIVSWLARACAATCIDKNICCACTYTYIYAYRKADIYRHLYNYIHIQVYCLFMCVYVCMHACTCV